jgi:putative ABC transport system ATP-binding protein
MRVSKLFWMIIPAFCSLGRSPAMVVAWIARALVSHPAVVLADEPTAALDSKSGRDVVNLMQMLAKEQGCTILMVTHDNRILDVADRIVHMEDGRLENNTVLTAA